MREQRSVFDLLRARGEEFFAQVTNEMMGNPRFIKAMQAAVRGKEWVDQAVAQALRTMNVPTRTEFKRALARLEALERELAEARRDAAEAKRQAGAAARARRPGASPRGSATKTAARTARGK